MISVYEPPFDPIPPTRGEDAFIEALRKTQEQALKTSQETQLAEVVTGCDGNPTAFIADGSACHDLAKPGAGGQIGLAVKLGPGGQRGILVAKLGRNMMPVTGYSGTTPGSAIPNPLAIGAVELGIDPEDSEIILTPDGAETSRGAHDSAILGATIAGKTGDSKRMVVCYSGNGAGLWDDIISGSETAISGLSNGPNYVGAVGGDVYYLTDLYNSVVSRIESGAEASTSSLPVFTGTGFDYAYSALAISRDLDTAAIVVNDNTAGKHGIYIGTSMLTAPSWAALDLGSIYNFQVYGTRALSFGPDGTLYAAVQTVAALQPRILVIAAPYSSVANVITPSWIGGGTWNDPSPLVWSRDGEYLAAGIHANSGLVDIIRGGGIHTTLSASGYTLGAAYGSMAWGPDGRLFALVRKTADGSYHLAVWTRTWGAPEIIDLSLAAGPSIDWLSVSGDGLVVAVSSNTAGNVIMVEPPYTAAGATVSSKSLSYPVAYQFEFDPSEAYQDADGLTLAASLQSATPSGSVVETVTRLAYANTGALDAFGVTIDLTVPETSTFVSATDGGLYDPAARAVKWFLPSLAADATGWVEVTTRVGE